MKYILKAFVQQVSTRFLASDATGTIHDDVAVFFSFQHVGRHWQLVAKRI